MPRRTIAVIPARAGSKRVPRKNLRIFNGRPLLTWSIMAALDGHPVDDVIVSTDDSECARLAAAHGAQHYERPDELAGDTAAMLDVLRHVVEEYRTVSGNDVEFVVLLQPTSPLRERGLIADGLARIRADEKATCLQTVFPVRLFTGRIVNGYWRGDYPESTRSQDLPTLYVPSGTLYIYRYDRTIAMGDAWGNHVLPLVQDPDTVVNIDEEADFTRLAQVAARHSHRYAYLLGS
ncbi:MAG TPA: acylneuraminate cytidylyltransferase family protein [Burkholderiales bacterium]|nr:acylneuraminate cytidylyltransferase family protein [Burkholderiales bacterium]